MIEISTAINSKAEADSALMNFVNDQFYLHKGPSDASLPYCSFFMVSDVPTYDHSFSAIENTLWQIDSWGKTAKEAMSLGQEVKRVFDNAVLNVEGYKALRCERQNADLIYEQDTEHYHYYVEYRIYVE